MHAGWIRVFVLIAVAALRVTPSVMAPAETALLLIGYLEHDSHRQPWLVNAKRQRITVKEVEIRTPPKSPEKILNAFAAAITPRTKVIATTHCDGHRDVHADQRDRQTRARQGTLLLRGWRPGAGNDSGGRS